MPAERADTLTFSAPAKINLFLEVLGTRDDGYHDLVTCMIPLALADELQFTHSNQLALTCDESSIPLDDHNLVHKAALALQRHTGSKNGAAIHLKKRIPAAAGLGGGSSDAATTLRGLNQLWQTNVPFAELAALAAQIGSDVPFFLYQSPAWCRGRGELVTPTKAGSPLSLLLICPQVGLSTAAVYQNLPASGERTDEQPLVQAFQDGNLPSLGRYLFNRLQPSAERLLPLVAELRQLIDSLAPEGLSWGHQMSGSGSSYFVVCRGETEAQRLARLVFDRWDGGVLNTGMGTPPKDGPPERTLRLFLTRSL